MPTYYVDDGGSATSPFDTWAKAATSLSALDDAVALASGDIVYIGHDHVCQFTHAANRTIIGPTSGKPCYIISATQGSSPPTYQASATNQVDTSEGAYQVNFSGVFALYGVCIKTGTAVYLSPPPNGSCYLYECTLKPGAGSFVANGSSATGSSKIVMHGCTIDFVADVSNQSVYCATFGHASAEMIGCTFTNGTYRTLSVLESLSTIFASGCDFTTFTNATACELSSRGEVVLSNCITSATWAPYSRDRNVGDTTLYNCGPADAPTYVFKGAFYGDLLSETTVYRAGGGAVEGSSCSWKVVTTANCSDGTPFVSPWMHGVISSTGSKTFTVYVANNTSDLTDAECWLEVEYLGTADEANTAFVTDARADITATAANQADDTGSTWNGATLTYMQSLAVTVTVNEDGLYRARVAVAKASATVYIDPKVTVS